MPLEHFWGNSTGNMPLKQAKTATMEESLPCQDGDNAGDTPELGPVIAKVMGVMTANITSLIDDKQDSMLHSINNNISQHLNKIGVRFDEGERRISAMEDTVVKTEKVSSLTKSVRELTECLQDEENRGCQKNLRILGLHEKVEGSDKKLERAHHIPGPASSKLPRAMIVRFHNFSDRQRVMEVV